MNTPTISKKDPLLEELRKELGEEQGIDISIPSKEDGEENEGQDKSFYELFAQLTMQEEIIIVINKEDEKTVREELSVVKARHTAKLKDSNIQAPKQKLVFIPHPDSPDLPEGQMKLQILLQSPKKVKIHQVIIPQGI